ncbi:FAD-dependent urate hydroxylase [Lachnellula willkommii]|uniref:FAD-dependent urate hydroxylase n=1 Tax=Lachnellula willkommii TaxID=215461 RepID=A0A559MFQ6_9HELO|nr:FAD-dependent urate hydroxylase [Lachnellula willkommii]
MAASTLNVAIIGSGLSGLALALTLHQQSIPCTIYEAGESPFNTGGGLMLPANGLKILDKLAVYEPLRKRGYSFDRIYLQVGERILEAVDYGGLERYGLRAYRFIVLEELLAAVKEKSIPIHFNRRFNHIISETESDVTWQFKDGSTETASLLVGADGIHSTVRSYLAPNIKPVFASMVAIVAAVPTAQLELPSAPEATSATDLNAASNICPLPTDIIVPRLGAFVIAPQTHNGDEVMITVQRPMTIEGRWADIDADKDYLRSLFRQNSEHFPSVVQNAVRDIPSDQLNIWPFYNIPRLERWTSAKTQGGFGWVIIVGDNAHALPPSAGQGVNQAFEDVYLLGRVLGRLGSGRNASNEILQQALFGWQSFRQARVDRVLELNRQMDLRRMPKAPGATEEKEEELLDIAAMYDWLFNIDFEKAVDEFLKGLD